MQRLKTRPQFQAILGGELVAKSSHFAIHRLDLNALDLAVGLTTLKQLFPINATWLGAMVPKRWAKRAVTRNAIKRQIYSVSDNLKPHFAEAAFLVRLRREFSRKDYSSASSTALKAAVRAELMVLMRVACVAGKAASVAV